MISREHCWTAEECSGRFYHSMYTSIYHPANIAHRVENYSITARAHVQPNLIVNARVPSSAHRICIGNVCKWKAVKSDYYLLSCMFLFVVFCVFVCVQVHVYIVCSGAELSI